MWRRAATQASKTCSQTTPEFKEAFEALDSDDPAALEALIIELLAAQFSGETVDTSKAVFGALADSVVGSFTDMLTDPEFLLSLLLGGAQGKMDELFEKYGLTAEVAIQRVRDMVVTAMNIKFGNPSELDGVGNLISTTAISGAGAANVGVAGAAAITLLETDTKAAISDLNGRIDASGVVTIYAQGAQKVYTTATALRRQERHAGQEQGRHPATRRARPSASALPRPSPTFRRPPRRCWARSARSTPPR